MDERSRRILEFPQVRERLAALTSFGPSRRLADALEPTSEELVVARLLDETDQARDLVSRRPDLGIGGARDIGGLITRARRGGRLTGSELLEILETLVSAGRVGDALRGERPTLLHELGRAIKPLPALRSRLEPHFLFNALNALRATIRRDPEQARALVSDLADLYRYLLHHPHDASVMNEVDHACAYLAIEKARLGNERLAVLTSIDQSVRDVRVPALLLQPIVENAVKHGITPRQGPGKITIRASDLGERLRIEVEDEADGPRDGLSTKGSGLALQTLRTRLDQEYDGNANLRLSSLERGTLVTVELPKQSERSREEG